MILALPLSASMRRALALLVLAAIFLILCVGVIAPVYDFWRAKSDEKTQALKSLAAIERVAGEEPTLRIEEKALAEANRKQNGFLDGASEPAATAALQSVVKQIIETQEGEVTSSQALPSTEANGFKKIAIRIDFRAGTEALPKIAYMTETSSFFIENVQIHGQQVLPSPGVALTSMPPLSVEWDVYGYMRKAAP